MTLWIVDYDLPVGNSRRKFYRHIEAWLKENGTGETARWSTYSVVITEDRDFAEFVFREATQLGRASLFKAELLAAGKAEGYHPSR